MSDAFEAEIGTPSAAVVERLVAGHKEFLSFLESRVHGRAAAEEILQAAFVKAIEAGDSIRESESAVAWFYRVLRNAIVDFYRHRASESRALDVHAREPELPTEPELSAAICQCMRTLIPSLKAEYAEVLERVDLAEQPIPEVALSLGISLNNATVRLHRARQALKRQLERNCRTCATHGCLDCTCSVR
jgi:RNA polymerase sigma factor (sigma-70 family)